MSEKAEGKKAFDLETLWHSTAHVMADAVKRLWPEIKLAIGPAIKEGFYYDFDKAEPFTAEDLVKIEEEMKKIIKENLKFEKVMLPRKEAEELLKKKGEIYKLEILNELPDKEISFYKHGDFIDMCIGPHVDYTSRIKAVKLLSSASAYWRGDSKNKMLYRIYGISFPTKAELDEYLNRLEEAKKRDHTMLGKQLDLFGFYPDTVGPGLVHWHPKGAMVRILMEDFSRKEHIKAGYQFVVTPHIGYSGLWETSGHLNFYKDSMYAPMEIDEKKYYIKPMNCPFHIQIFKSKPRSYRDLPMKLAEFGTVYRYEISGALHGLIRVRGFTQDDAHIFCTPEQVEQQIEEVLRFVVYILNSFGFKEFKTYLSVRDPENKSKYIGNDEMWELAEKSLSKALDKLNMSYQKDIGGAAFYGPKIDVKILDALGREHQCSTIQFDFNLPEKFDVTYIGEDGNKHRLYMVHRALFGSFERFFGILIEHHAGAFPVWLAPIQVRVLSVADRNINYAKKIKDKLAESDIRVELDESQATVEYKIREAELEKIPYILVIGDKEEEKQSVAVRERGNSKVRFDVKIEDLIKEIKEKVKNKA